MKKRCPKCQQEIDVHPDGSFVMHGQPSGGLCPGTNCEMLEDGRVRVGNVRLPATNIVFDPDGTLEEWPLPEPGHAKGHHGA